MASTDLIGWASLAAFALGFGALYLFITRPSRRLEKLLGDGVRLGLRRLDPKEVEGRLAPFFAAAGSALTLGSVYQRGGGGGFLLAATEKTKRGSKTTYRHSEKYVYSSPTGLQVPFGVMPKPPDNRLSRFALGMVRKLGMEIREDDPALLPEFRDRFFIHGPASGGDDLRVPRGVQQALLRTANRTGGFDVVKVLPGADGISFQPEGFVIHIGNARELRTLDQVRGLLELAEGIETGLRLG